MLMQMAMGAMLKVCVRARHSPSHSFPHPPPQLHPRYLHMCSTSIVGLSAGDCWFCYCVLSVGTMLYSSSVADVPIPVSICIHLL